MDPESKQLIQETFTLTEENNKLLHKIRGVQKRELVWHTLKIIVIVGIALGSFYFLEPYLTKLTELYKSISGIEQKINNSPVQGLLKNL